MFVCLSSISRTIGFSQIKTFQILGISVYNARLEMGNELAEVLRSSMNVNDIDVVIPVSLFFFFLSFVELTGSSLTT